MKTDNEVLAEFLKWNKAESGNFMVPNTYPLEYPDTGETEWTEDAFNFHDRFDWLMPVWYKFRDLKLELPLGQYKTYRDYWHRIANDIPRKDIAEVCKLLAKGIRWYNETVKK